jgi:DNA polymerase-1
MAQVIATESIALKRLPVFGIPISPPIMSDRPHEARLTMANPDQPKPFILVDGSAYLFRAFHALPPLSTSQGEPTGAVYGVLSMLRRLLSDYEPVHMAVVFDARGETFRNRLYPDYKANRPPTPPDLSCQIEPLHAAVRAMGIPVVVVPDVEADDVIGTLVSLAQAAGMDTLVSSGDKDLTQLVSDRVTMIDTMQNVIYDGAGVERKFGVPPERIIDYLALIGDKIDNVPGVPGVGPKTAVKWLQTYGSLDEILEQASQIKGKAGENLRAAREQLSLSRDLVTIRRDLALAQQPAELKLAPPDRSALRDLLQRLEFTTLLRQLEGDTDEEEASNRVDQRAPADYETVLSMERLDAWIARLQSADLFAFDTETTSLNYMDARIVGVSFAVEEHQAAYVPLAHDDPATPAQLSRDAVLERLRPLLEDPARPKLGQNLKYDISVLAGHGIELQGLAHDTMLESYVLDSTGSRHDMDTLALKHLAHQTIHYEDVAGKGAKQVTFDKVPVSEAAPYAAEDADVTLRLHNTLWPRLAAMPTLELLYQQTEIPLVPVLSRIERQGVLIDRAQLERQSAELAERMAGIKEQAYEAAGEPFNLGSPKQIQTVLFERMQLPVRKKTPKGQPSTSEAALEELAQAHELPRLILQHRGLSKLKSTYTDRLPEQINPRTGRVHTSYHQAVAATGRLSSSDPNLQNIPVRTEEGRRIRQAFVAPSGCVVLAADYSQIELRIMAHLSADEGLLQAFAAGADIHRATAAEIFAVAPAEVSDAQRRSAKAINFGLIYGMSAFGLAQQLGIARSAAQDYVDLYFTRYPGVLRFMNETRESAHERGFVETVFGRRLHLPEINSRNAQRRQYAERTAINAPMQGTAADIIKRAMLAVDTWLRSANVDARIIMQVHDELVFEVAEGETAKLSEAVVQCMSQAAELAVPLVVDIGTGANWDEAH